METLPSLYVQGLEVRFADTCDALHLLRPSSVSTVCNASIGLQVELGSYEDLQGSYQSKLETKLTDVYNLAIVDFQWEGYHGGSTYQIAENFSNCPFCSFCDCCDF
eukprot:3131824-Amphidinium_carterae.1